MVEKPVVYDGTRLRRWNGDSMENSSCTASEVTGTKGTYLSHDHSESSMV